MTRTWRAALGGAVGAGAALVAAGCGTEGDVPASGPLAGRTVTFSLSVAEDEKRGGPGGAPALHAGERRARHLGLGHRGGSAAKTQRSRCGRAARRFDLFARIPGPPFLVDEDLVEDVSDVPVPDGVLRPMIPERFEGRQYFPALPAERPGGLREPASVRQAGCRPDDGGRTAGRGRQLKAAAGGIARVTLPLAQGAPAAVTIAEWIVGFGGNPLVLNDQGSVQAFEFLRTLWAEGSS